ncbi:hypothetical protein [Roseovarius sp.]|uniref:hypothetical protein n=1 Tax=Roseovarius sp. TaxID=1486281 RepID=UPI003BA9535E
MANKPDAAAVAAALKTLSPDDFGDDSTPNMKPLNKALKDAGFAQIKASERDALLPEILSGEPELEDIPQGMVRVRLDASDASPLPFYVHGFGMLSLQEGEEADIPVSALDALRNSDHEITVIGVNK